jgi:hypothetical protein
MMTTTTMMATGDDDDEVDDDCDGATCNEVDDDCDGAMRTDDDVGPRRQRIVVGGASAAPSDVRAAAQEPCI